jgi:hypothetical protein
VTEHDDDAWLDRMLDAAPEVKPSAALRRAVAEIPLRHPHAPRTAIATRFAWRAVLTGALLATLAGVLAGSYGDALELDSVSPLASEEAAEPWEDIAVLAFADELDTELSP